jgi:hypothetical protein
VCMPSDRSPR